MSKKQDSLKSSVEVELQQTKAELARLKTDFVEYSRIVSHDLSAPFRQIRAFSELVQVKAEDVLEEDILSYLGHINEVALKGQKTIEGLLEYYRLSVQIKTLEEVSLDACLGTALKRLRRKHTQNADIHISPMPTILCDAELMERLFYRMLDNAMLYQPEGQRPHVLIAAKTEGNWVSVTMKDNGIGMRSQTAHECFNPLTRLSADNRFSGTGMGLSNAQRIAELHGGKIDVVSSLGEGTEFTIRLPTG